VRLVRDEDLAGSGLKGEDEVVMQMVGLVPFAWDTVDVESDESGLEVRTEDSAGLFDHFTPGGFGEGLVVRLDMAAWEQPAMKAAMVHQQQTVGVGCEDEARASDVAGSELAVGEGLRRTFEQEEDEFAAFERFAVGRIVERADEC
jgi:hypothetical protein